MIRQRASRALALSTAGLAVAALAGTGVALAPATATKPGSGSSVGRADVFMVNPVQSSGDQGLVDAKDSAAAVPASAYARVELRNLDGSGHLSGAWANVRTNTGSAAYSASNEFFFTRDADQFEQVMGYFWINEAQEYLQSLGFGTSLPAILERPFDVRIDQYGQDNSYMWDKHDYIRLGKGGVDDAEDAEVIVHEYGHAVHHDQVPGFGEGLDAGAIGESFGDYLAVSVGLAATDRYGWPHGTDFECPMDWDAVSYDPTAPHCIRVFNTDRTVATRFGTIHRDGQIWSQALWEIREAYGPYGGSRAWDTTLILSQFDYAPDTSWSAAAEATYLVALYRDGVQAAAVVKDRFAARGITF